MPRGGKRPGAGRPKGSTSRRSTTDAKILASVAAGDTPLDVGLRIMRKAEAEGDLKLALQAMKACAPFIHQRFSPTDQPAKPHVEQAILPLWESKPKAAPEPGKKEAARIEAETAGVGTEWGDLLKPDRPN